MSRIGYDRAQGGDQSADIILKYVLRRDRVKHTATSLADTWKWKSFRTLRPLSGRSAVLCGIIARDI